MGTRTYSFLAFSKLSIITALRMAFMNITSSTRQTHLAPLNLTVKLYQKNKKNQDIKNKERNPVRITFLLAQREGFEPSCGVIHKLISSN